MAYEKLKDELYKNLGGINVKASDYMTGENQVLDLRNYTFDRPGSWVSRPGYTGFATLNAGGSYAPDSIFEAVFSGFSNSLYNNPDLDLFLYASGTTLYNRTSLNAIASGLGPGSSGSGPVDFQIFNNVLYFANGYAFKKFDTNLNYKYSIPSGNDFTYGATAPGATFASLFSPGGTGSAGFYAFQIAPARRLNGPSLFEIGQVNNSVGSSYLCVTLAAASQGAFTIYFGKTLPFSTSLFTSYGVSYAAMYVNAPGTGGVYNLDQIVPLDQFVLGLANGTTQYTYSFDFPKPSGNVFTFPRSSSQPETDQYFTLAPQFLETYNNMMFMAGFSTQPSVVYHSELGNADKVEPEYFFEVRTSGNGDNITCLKVFQDSLVIYKKYSTHLLSGDSPETLSLQDATLDYGCLNNLAAVTFENKLWAMDQKGIAEYNGANTYIVSSPIEKYLNECDKSTARGYHLKKYFQVWYLVKVSGSSDWRAFVYDYLINAWTIYDKFNVTGGSNLFENSDTTKDLVFYGQNASLQSKFMKFGDIATDDSFGITHIIYTKFHKRLGDSTQEMWRRLFLNNNVSGASIGVNINFIPDYGSSIYLTRQTNLNQFQSRLDFGISAKALAVEMILNASEKVTINGYTIESRYLRSV